MKCRLADFSLRSCRVLGVLALLWLVGCGRKEAPAEAEMGVGVGVGAGRGMPEAVAGEGAKAGGGSQEGKGVPRSQDAVAGPTPAPKAPLGLELTPEMESAAVVVRVTVAQTLLREHTGVLLRPESFARTPVTAESRLRLVAVLLPTYDEAALRDPECAFQVLRQKLDEDGRPYVLQTPGALVHYDAQSHAAVVQYVEDFASRLDWGLSPGPDAAAGAAGLCLLAAAFEAPPPALPGQPPQPRPRLKREQSSDYVPPGGAMAGTIGLALLPVRLQQGMLRLAAEAAAATTGAVARVRVAAVLDAEGRLVGHASRKTTGEQSWVLQPAAVPAAVEEQRLLYVPLSVETGVLQKTDYTGKPGYIITVKGLLKDPLRELSSGRLAVQNLPTTSFPPVADARANQPPILPQHQYHHLALQADGSFRFELNLPEGAKSANHLVQVQLMKRDFYLTKEAAFHAAPFMVVTETDKMGSRPKVLGLVGLAGAEAGSAVAAGSATNMPAAGTTAAGTTASPRPVSSAGRAAPVVATVSKMLSTESRILHGVPICEGREVLFRLEGAPYWKRLSLAEGKWLPLPAAEDLALCHLAGNSEALFLLRPGQREIRRYHAATLALEKTERLPDGMNYQGLAAGCLTASGPVAVLTDAGALACDPRELRVRPTPNLHKPWVETPPPAFFYHAAGDGGAVWGSSLEKSVNAQWRHTWRYEDEVVGFSEKVRQEIGQLPTMAATSPWGRDISGEDVCGSLCNSPNFFLLTGNRRKDSPRATPAPMPRCTLYSNYVDDPWAAVDVPEAREVPPEEWGTFPLRLWLDTESLTLAVWHGRLDITLHTLDKTALPQPAVPVLLNYPDCHVPRGGSFRFIPKILGGVSKEVTLSSPPEGLAVDSGGALNWPVPKDMPPENVTFGLKLAGPVQAQAQPQRPCEVQVKLRLGGQKPLLAVPASLSGTDAEKAVEELGSGHKPGLPLVPLSFRHYFSSSPIDRVQPLNDYLALSLRNRTLLLLSVKDWQVAGSRTLADKDHVFVAGDVLFIYNTDTRTLSRHALPSFTMTGRMIMPGNSKLFGLGTGTTPEGPLTLLRVEMVPINKPGYSADMTYTRIDATILDKQTLASGRWAAYRNREGPGKWNSIFQSVHPMERPVSIPCSRDGRLLNFPDGMIVISPGLTLDFDYHRNPQDVEGRSLSGVTLNLNSAESPVVSASPKGGRMYSGGRVFFNNYYAFKVGHQLRYHGISTCGNYIATLKTNTTYSVPESGQEMAVYSAADGRPLFNIAGLDLLRLHDDKNIHDTGVDDQRPLVTPLGDKNLLVLLSRGGTVMEAVDLDFERVCRMVNPATACVTSHPTPVVTEGRRLEYQVTVNNPDTVSGYELQDTTQGAEISPKGLLTYQAPDGLDHSQQFKIAIRIRFTNGETAVQVFPIYVIALKAEAAAARKAVQEKEAAMGIKKA